jgi:hypothetical protein
LRRKKFDLLSAKLSPMRKARIWRAFLIVERIFSKIEDRWLTIQGSNFHVPDSKKPFEMSGEYRPIFGNRR